MENAWGSAWPKLLYAVYAICMLFVYAAKLYMLFAV